MIDGAARDRWMELMTAALEESMFAPEVRSVLLAYLGPAAAAMINSG